MKILISNDGMHAHYHERLSWVNAFNSIPGIEAVMYNVKQVPAFYIFDKYEPDVYIGQLYNLDSATIKCLNLRPHIKTILRAGEWNNEPQDNHILYTNEEELDKLSKIDIEFIHIHYRQEDIEKTHSNFINKGYKVIGIPMSADLHTYAIGGRRKEFECDMAFVGGYWPYKGEIIDKYFTPLCFGYKYHIKIFGNQPWPHINQYCGLINDKYVGDLFRSAKICPNLSEPHSHTKGIDVNERAFKVLAAGGFVISDYVQALEEMLPSVPKAKTPEEFHEKIDYFLGNEKERVECGYSGRREVLNSHTNFHRIITILNELEEEEFAEDAGRILNDYINHL